MNYPLEDSSRKLSVKEAPTINALLNRCDLFYIWDYPIKYKKFFRYIFWGILESEKGQFFSRNRSFLYAIFSKNTRNDLLSVEPVKYWKIPGNKFVRVSF